MPLERVAEADAVLGDLRWLEGLRAVFIADEGDNATNVWSADWVLVTGNDDFVNLPAVSSARDSIVMPAGLRLWTDDYNSLLPIWKWGR